MVQGRRAYDPEVPRRGPAVVALAALAALAAGCGGGDETPTATCGEVESLVEATFNHVLPGPDVAPSYSWSPPTSGTHLSAPPPAPGVHDEPIAPVAQVTALEAGTVLVQYDATVPGADVEVLEALADGRDDLIVAPVAAPIDGDQHVAATAWGRRLRCDGVAEAPLEAFLADHAGAADVHG